MNKLFAKIAGLTAALAMVAGAGVALAHHAEAKGVRATDASWTASEQGYSNAEVVASASIDSVASITFDTGSSSNACAYYDTGTAVRIYSGASFTVSVSEGALSSIVLDYVFNGSATISCSDSSNWDAGNKTWSGSSNSVTWTAGTAKHVRLSSVSVVYSTGDTPTPPTQYTVSFNANGGSGEMADVLVNEGAQYPLPANGFTAPEGKQFKCWSVNDEEKNPNESITVNAAVEVTAVWEDIPEPPAGATPITLSKEGGTKAYDATVNGVAAVKCGTSSAAGAMKLTVGANATKLNLHLVAWSTETSNVVTPTAEGVTFVPSTLSIKADSGIAGNSSDYTLAGVESSFAFSVGLSGVGDSAKEITLTATTGKRFVIWDASYEVGEPPVVVTYDVIFNANGEGVTNLPAKLTEQPGVVSLSNVAEPSREGYTFKGWSLTTDGAVVTQVTVSNDDVNVYAIWEAVTPEPTREDLPVGDYEVEVSYAGRTSVPTEEYFEIKEPVGETYYKRLKIEYVGVQFLYSNEYTMPKNNPGKKISVSTDSNAKITSVEVNWYQYENATVYIDGVASSTPSGAKGDNENKISYNINANNFELVNNTNYAQSLWGMKISLSVSAVAEPEVAFDNVETSLQVGDSGTYTATSENATNPVYTWSSDNAEVLSITAGGEYHALKAGSAKVTVDLACDEGADSKSVTVLVSPDHTLTVAEAREIANGLDGDKQETTPYRVKVSGYIVSLDADTKTRAFNLSDSKVSAAGDTIMAYGIYSNDPIRQYAILNGTIEFECSIQNYKGTLEVKDLALVSYIDDAMLFAKGAYEALQESCNAGVQAVTETLWGQIAQVYENQLDEYAKAKLQAADVSNYGQDIINWTARYEIIVSNTSLNNFLSRTIGAGRYVSILPSMMANDGSIVIIAIITIASISAIAALIVIKKRKHQ